MIFLHVNIASLGDFSNELDYCKLACKAAVPELTDDDFDPRAYSTIHTGGITALIEYIKARKNKNDILILPQTGINSYRGSYAWNYYPDVQIAMPFAKDSLAIAGSSLPETFTLSTPNRIPMIISVGGGDSGLSDWYTGTGLEFTEQAPGMYKDGASLITSFAITNVTSPGGGVTRIYSSAFGVTRFTAAKWKIHITGVAGFGSNPNGSFNITAINTGSGYIEISHDTVSGSWTNGTGTVRINYMSGAVSSAAAKIYYISKMRNCGMWEARKCAQMTGSQAGSWDSTHGYGSINVSDAIDYEGTIGDDPHDTLGSIGTLALNLDEDGIANFSHPEITNARKIKLYRDDILICEGNLSYGGSFEYAHYPVKLKSRNYKAKAFRVKQSTEFSNTVNTNIDSLSGYPMPTKLNEGDTAYYLKGKDLVSSQITKIEIDVNNPNYDNKGLQTNKYKFANGDVIEEIQNGPIKLYYTKRHYFWTVNGNPLNEFFIPIVEPDIAGPDLCGYNFFLSDFTANGDVDFTGAYVIGTDFSAATLPAAFEAKEDFKAAVAAYDPVTTIWTDGLPIGE